MKWKELKKAAAEELLGRLFHADDCSPTGVKPSLGREFEALGLLLQNKYNEALEENGHKRDYTLDLIFAFKLYGIFSEGSYHMTIRDAANTNIWRFLSVEVVPAVTMDRWRGDGCKLPVDHFYEKPNRIYLKTLWWYIFLSWQGSAEETRDVLEGNSTDTIVNLVERVGRYGYHPDLYRKIMYKFSCPGTGLQPHNADLFRKVMKLHTARFANLEPALYNGGISGYVKELFEYFKEERTAGSD